MRRRRRFLFGLLIVPLVLVAGRLAWFIYLSEPSRQITIGRETTYLDGPLAGDGLVDYIAAVEQQSAEGATPENNAVVLLWEAFGSKETTVEDWREQFRRLGAPVPPTPIVEQIPLDLLVAASRRPRYYAPAIVHLQEGEFSRLGNVLLPLSQALREGTTRLLGRAGQRMSDGDVDGAWDDILACHRLARLVAQDPCLVNSLGGMAHERTASDAAESLMANPALDADRARRCLQDLESLTDFSPVAGKFEHSTRLMALDTALAVARRQPVDPYKKENRIRLALPGAIDWIVVLRDVNDHFDQLVAAATDPDPAMRSNRLQELADVNGTVSDARIAFALQAFLGEREQASHDLAKVIIGAVPEFFFTCLRTETSTLARSRAEKIGFALAIHKREHGAYPESLAALVPEAIEQLPADPWIADAFIYHRTDNGFILNSVGPNQRDNGGGLTTFAGTDDSLMDDIIMRVETE